MTDQPTPAEETPTPRPKRGKRAANAAPSPEIPAAEPPPADDPIDEDTLRRELMEELDHLIARVRKSAPDYSPPPFSPKRLIQFLQENLQRFSPDTQQSILERLRNAVGQDFLDVDTWKGIWFMLNYTVEYRGDQFKRRFTGEYQTDPWGMDYEFIEVVQPLLDFLQKQYFRLELTGLEHIPDAGRAILVANHSGQFPWDGLMLNTAVLNSHPSMRTVRVLFDPWFATVPFLGDSLVRFGQVVATEENGETLLEQDELIAVFPEGNRAMAKTPKNQYKLARFDPNAFIRMALKTGAPIIPVAIVGSEETAPTLHRSRTLAALTGAPFFPLPLFGPLPLPAKWYVDIAPPIPTDSFGADRATDPTLISQLADLTRNHVRQMLNSRLTQRRSVYFG
ncbi:MAG: acyltransferase family protein [Anaerolineales bacterium]|nr:acyltransferase family protein [Anaerolineales bacterium]